jgi:FO synthase/2-phospho-L-lactate guanylyltransferase
VLYCLIPIKDLDGAKTRLAGVLDGPSRRELVIAMYRDVLSAATTCAAVDRVAVVTNDAEARSIAQAAGASTLGDTSGLNAALASAAEIVSKRGAERLLVLFADLPLANVAAIERVARADAAVALVPSSDGGTNALALPPGAIEFHYGQRSAGKHIATAESAGLTVISLDEPTLAFDIDTRADLERLTRSQNMGTHTLTALGRIVAGGTTTTRG